MSINCFSITAGTFLKIGDVVVITVDHCDGPGNIEDNHMGLGSIWYVARTRFH
jgi:hypothetical protein